ncbi:hypothetical protein [Falsirhodobacter halotolerans]|uniref:hypothetical protein n=1 Tax=Falsirhodobacter halotolerans TaxID=1146892 RepID=UPI001FD5F2FC|nr:hypothetical protein [Falsirhodobacter halotolerans]MCJ8138867.1 hypothetical protein [Falsirhodobacter halotolerans]
MTVAAVLATVAVAGCSDPYAGNQYGTYYGATQAPRGNQPINNAAIRTLGGAAAGALVADATKGSKTQGALIGALAGGGSCAIPGQNCN